MIRSRTLANERAQAENNVYSGYVNQYIFSTGKVPSSKQQEQAISSYADAIFEDYTIVPDEFVGPKGEKTITESEQIKILDDAFKKLDTKTLSASDQISSDIWKTLSTPEWWSKSDEEKSKYIASQGMNPEDFGY
jgi:hypothetical protein